MELKKFYSVKELTKLLGVSKSLLYKQIEETKIPSRKIGARILIPGTYVSEILQMEGEICL